LTAIEQSDAKAADKLLPLVYEELRRLATCENVAGTTGSDTPTNSSRPRSLHPFRRLRRPELEQSHSFFTAAVEALRRILIDKVYRKQHLKRGRGQQKLGLEDAEIVVEAPSDDLTALDEALSKLADTD
jgi:hypothetical protein